MCALSELPDVTTVAVLLENVKQVFGIECRE